MSTATDFVPGSIIHERVNSGIYVWLLYSFSDNQLRVAVREGEEGSVASALVDPANALDAFEHPYCYVGKATTGETDTESEGRDWLDGLEEWKSLRESDEGERIG